MRTLEEFMNSGLLELYVLGQTTAAENAQIEAMAAVHPELRREIDQIAAALEHYALLHAVPPSPTAKTFLLAILDYTERLARGEAPTDPPLLTETSQVGDYTEWLERPDLQGMENFDDFSLKIIGHTPEKTTAIGWIKTGLPAGRHDHEHEKWLVVEGRCEMTVDGSEQRLEPGDYYAVPLHATRSVSVLPPGWCKVIWQRVRA